MKALDTDQPAFQSQLCHFTVDRVLVRHWTRTFSFLICKTGVLPTSLQGCEVNSYLLNTYHMPGTIPRLGDPVTGNSCCHEA